MYVGVHDGLGGMVVGVNPIKPGTAKRLGLRLADSPEALPAHRRLVSEELVVDQRDGVGFRRTWEWMAAWGSMQVRYMSSDPTLELYVRLTLDADARRIELVDRRGRSHAGYCEATASDLRT